MDTLMGQAAPRLEASLKVTGAARYPGEMPIEGLLHAALVTAPLAHGRVLRIDTAKARALPGVVDILTHENADRLPPTEYLMLLQEPVVPHAGAGVFVTRPPGAAVPRPPIDLLLPGRERVVPPPAQPVALVVAETAVI